MTKLLEKQTLRLRSLSPIHIKGKDVNYGEGFVRRNTGSAYAIDVNKLAEYLALNDPDLMLVEKYASLVETAATRNKLKEFDNEKFLADAGIYHHQRNKTKEQDLIRCGVFKSIVNAPSEDMFIRDGLGRPFIPGSSLKGVIRTAVSSQYFMVTY